MKRADHAYTMVVLREVSRPSFVVRRFPIVWFPHSTLLVILYLKVVALFVHCCVLVVDFTFFHGVLGIQHACIPQCVGANMQLVAGK